MKDEKNRPEFVSFSNRVIATVPGVPGNFVGEFTAMGPNPAILEIGVLKLLKAAITELNSKKVEWGLDKLEPAGINRVTEIHNDLPDLYEQEKFRKEIVDWVGRNDIIQYLDEDDLTRYIRDTYSPQDVFSKEELSRWAENNGFEEEE